MSIKEMVLFVLAWMIYDTIKDYKINRELEKVKAECKARSENNGE